ncbi:hypothetical protein M0R45_009548 [Rubus argutus]|uniref:Uncharacterized protein n=1 Tax=Rubus argutus TaxID=59490 RepID=A0AAW1Y6E0_RUBAR
MIKLLGSNPCCTEALASSSSSPFESLLGMEILGLPLCQCTISVEGRDINQLKLQAKGSCSLLVAGRSGLDDGARVACGNGSAAAWAVSSGCDDGYLEDGQRIEELGTVRDSRIDEVRWWTCGDAWAERNRSGGDDCVGSSSSCEVAGKRRRAREKKKRKKKKRKEERGKRAGRKRWRCGGDAR